MQFLTDLADIGSCCFWLLLLELLAAASCLGLWPLRLGVLLYARALMRVGGP